MPAGFPAGIHIYQHVAGLNRQLFQAAQGCFRYDSVGKYDNFFIALVRLPDQLDKLGVQGWLAAHQTHIAYIGAVQKIQAPFKVIQ
jgi:hypothetical protein